jgi:hypothetical protein
MRSLNVGMMQPHFQFAQNGTYRFGSEKTGRTAERQQVSISLFPDTLPLTTAMPTPLLNIRLISFGEAIRFWKRFHFLTGDLLPSAPIGMTDRPAAA